MPPHPPPRTAALALIATILLSAVPAPGAAQTTCRSDALGATVCTPPPGPRPRPRPLFDDRTRGLDRVQPTPPAGEQSPEIIPGWRTNSFGRTLFGPGETRPGGRCRTDALGNTHCR